MRDFELYGKSWTYFLPYCEFWSYSSRSEEVTDEYTHLQEKQPISSKWQLVFSNIYSLSISEIPTLFLNLAVSRVVWAPDREKEMVS